jgi:uncharacterized membrane protein
MKYEKISLISHEYGNIPVGIILIPVTLHIIFFVLESILFSNTKSIQKLFLGKDAASSDAVNCTSKYISNQGYFNLMLACGLLYALFSLKDKFIVSIFLLHFVGASLVLVFSKPAAIVGAAIQGIPALVALYMIQ